MQIACGLLALGDIEIASQTKARELVLSRLWEVAKTSRKEDGCEEERRSGYVLESARLGNLYLLESVHRMAQKRRTRGLHEVFLRMALGV